MSHTIDIYRIEAHSKESRQLYTDNASKMAQQQNLCTKQKNEGLAVAGQGLLRGH